MLQLPIVKSKVKKLLQGAVKKIALLGAPVIPSSDDSLEQFLQSAGRFFGKDPAKWDQVGEKFLPCSRGFFAGLQRAPFLPEGSFLRFRPFGMQRFGEPRARRGVPPAKPATS